MVTLDDRIRKLQANIGTRLSQPPTQQIHLPQLAVEAIAGIRWLWSKCLWPILRPAWRTINFLIIKPYLWSWSRFTSRRGRFSNVRAGIMIVATLVFLFEIPMILDAAYCAVLYSLTARVNESVILLGSQQINDHGVHIVEGCEQLPCSDMDSIYFRTDDNELFDNLWTWFHGRGWWFYTEYVGAAVPYAMSKCVVTDYGWAPRGRLRILRVFNTYAYVLAVSCRPL